jgi:predicted O-methyltransferase YrrM
MALLPARIRRLTPDGLRDQVHMRALAVGLGVIPPRTMHSDADVRVLLEAAAGARRAVEIGVYEGASALALYAALGSEAELHLIDPLGRHPDTLPRTSRATEWATKRVIARAARAGGPRVSWHIAPSHEVAAGWSQEVQLVFIDGDHYEEACALDWSCWHRFVSLGGHVVFHDARAGLSGGRGLPGPTSVVDRRFRPPGETPGWEIAAEADRTVAVRRVA